ncbi:Proteasome subunit beta type-5 [Diplonema papillatum]|nr:Proteasome subunit beta type-5 [Diplonema papillatum]
MAMALCNSSSYLGSLLERNFVKEMQPRATLDTAREEVEDIDLSQVKIAVCPQPSSIPKLDLRKGTTTLAFVYQGGVIVAVDSRASTGQYIASGTVQKVIEINTFMLGTLAGGAADCQYWQRVLGQECRLWELRNKQRITIAAASKILNNICYSYRNHGLSMGLMLAGWDYAGPSLYMIDDNGTRLKGDLYSVGSGSIYAYGVLDEGYRHDLTDAEAIELGRSAILAATHRDAGSGGYINVYHVHDKNEAGMNWTKISRDDCMDIWAQAQKDGRMAALGPMDP